MNQIIFLSLKGLGLIIIIIKLRSYQKWEFLLDQKHIFEISLEIQLTPFLASFQSSLDVCSASHTKHTARAIAGSLYTQKITPLFQPQEKHDDLSVRFVCMTLLRACIKQCSWQYKRKDRIEKVGLALIEAWLATSAAENKQQ